MATQDPALEISAGMITKMKVAELKKELKARGLSTAGTKTELVERLQSAGSQSAQDLISEDGNAESEILDEDDVLEGVEGEEFDDDDDDLTAEAVLADEPKIKTPPASTPVPAKILTSKRPAPASESPKEVQPKKRILVRPISVTTKTGTENGSEEKSPNVEFQEEKPVANGKKIVKLSGLSEKERLELRAQKFGVPLPESAKKEARAARFGPPTSGTTKTLGVNNSTKISFAPSEDVLKKRAERFGVNVSSLALKAEEKEKQKKRLERFGLSATPAANLEDKKKLRAERFKI